jgi:hypothetical protein
MSLFLVLFFRIITHRFIIEYRVLVIGISVISEVSRVLVTKEIIRVQGLCVSEE